ncbi:Rsa1p SKDI_16G0840 [Saccharomyces kudriavzevii IFO 1802]|uniref:FMR1-interacting protein 1 conserved domain-containing protein n=1 Tax=Saccharomyces kudriavzevii (strain ATCC MYA-4449 / AS 2.2408 / CBS 8840 / NBRC 1802 / NCYC 2889) TaxID=226230 RepID=A0AA35J9M2_SACK1|nr:uncharacterized protein SKDI_16G0840 [Saccharomyces kudriavzevii IFO 1802]CAI4052913.1 hypothetical protein SKDI_16G0840 [Saccharomyces kudriavzevii IFO 1802]
MNYNNYGDSNNGGNSRLPKPTYSGTLSDEYDESKIKRQNAEPISIGYSPNLYSNSSYHENSWNSGYNSQLHTLTPHNQYFHPTQPQPTQYNFPNPTIYTRNGIPPVDHHTPYSPPELPNRLSPYCESATALKRSIDYRRSVSYEDVTLPAAKKACSVQQEKKEGEKVSSKDNLKLLKQNQSSLKPLENSRKSTKVSNFNIQSNHNVAPDKEKDSEKSESESSEKVVLVPGTSISLITDEDIKKWREERKKMWLLKISNNKTKHMQSMGIKEEELKGRPSILRESRKEKQFIQSIQNQVQRGNPRVDLNIKLIQREFASENSQLLDFIRELGDAGLLEYELTQEEKDILFGTFEDNNRNNYKPNYRNRKTNLNRNNFSRHK